MMRRTNGSFPNRFSRGFSLVEVIVSLLILAIGVLTLIRLFPLGVQISVTAERTTHAALLGEEIIESIKTMSAGGMVRIIPGSRELVPMPGDGLDTDNDAHPTKFPDRFDLVDVNNNGSLDSDFDGWPEKDVWMDLQHGLYNHLEEDYVDDDLDGIPNDNGDSESYEDASSKRMSPVTVEFEGDEFIIGGPDWDLSYDPEYVRDDNLQSHFGVIGFGVDEEYPNGLDDDLDGLIDEDCILASQRNPRTGLFDPLRPGNGLDDDGDGEEGSPVKVMRDPYSSDVTAYKIADGIDNNGDGRIDEGIDEEIHNGIDDDGDGLIDEDCRASCYPFTPRKFPGLDAEVVEALMARSDIPFRIPDNPELGWPYRPNEFAWQIRVARVPDGGGDGIDNDGDGRVDEEIRNGIDDDNDDLIDEDCKAAPLPKFRKITVLITWNGDKDQNNDGFPGEVGVDDDGDGYADFSDPEIVQGMLYDANNMLNLGIESLSEIAGSPVWQYLRERWAMDDDEDGRIDEEKRNGLDDDFDGRIDEDEYTDSYSVSTILQIAD